MDNQKSYCPRELVKGKKTAGMLRLPTKITGCIIYSGHYEENRKIAFYINHDHFEQASNMVVTTIFKLLQVYLEDFGRFPKTLRLFADNCWRENKNRYVFSFLAKLVKLGIFDEATIDFLIVGHTGNEVDQLFSILTNEFKGEILSVQELLKKISTAPIKPKPKVEHLFFIWDWKKFVENQLHPLEYHTFFNSFQIKREGVNVKFRYKRLPQDQEFGPAAGMKLLKSSLALSPVSVADFRIEQLQLDKLFRSLEVFFQALPIGLRMEVVADWQAIKKTLEALPLKKPSLPKMDLSTLQGFTHSVELPRSPDRHQDGQRDIQGEFFEETVDEGIIEEEIREGIDVCVYTKNKQQRPWVGRVVKIEESSTFVIHWYQKVKGSRTGQYEALQHDDGSPYLSKQMVKSVMFWAFTEETSDSGFVISPYWHSCLKREYEKLDQ